VKVPGDAILVGQHCQALRVGSCAAVGQCDRRGLGEHRHHLQLVIAEGCGGHWPGHDKHSEVTVGRGHRGHHGGTEADSADII
jgi:hypothetical protein